VLHGLPPGSDGEPRGESNHKPTRKKIRLEQIQFVGAALAHTGSCAMPKEKVMSLSVL
jgi:hypothetical protein